MGHHTGKLDGCAQYGACLPRAAKHWLTSQHMVSDMLKQSDVLSRLLYLGWHCLKMLHLALKGSVWT
jgi:hypothetical protein